MRRGTAVRVVGPLHWLVYPSLLVVAATIVLGTQVRIFGLPLPEPVFPMILAFAWPLIRPSMMGPVALFALGLFTDLFHYNPLGLWALACLGVYAIVLFARPFIIGQDTPILVAWYLGLCAGVSLFTYLFVMLDVKVAPSLVAVLLQFVPTALLCPIAIWLVQRFDDGDVRFR